MEDDLNRCRYAKQFGNPFANNKAGPPKNANRPAAGAAYEEKGMASRTNGVANSFTGYDNAPPPQTAQFKDWAVHDGCACHQARTATDTQGRNQGIRH
jgi:hypothetical protein